MMNGSEAAFTGELGLSPTCRQKTSDHTWLVDWMTTTETCLSKPLENELDDFGSIHIFSQICCTASLTRGIKVIRCCHLTGISSQIKIPAGLGQRDFRGRLIESGSTTCLAHVCTAGPWLIREQSRALWSATHLLQNCTVYSLLDPSRLSIQAIVSILQHSCLLNLWLRRCLCDNHIVVFLFLSWNFCGMMLLDSRLHVWRLWVARALSKDVSRHLVLQEDSRFATGWAWWPGHQLLHHIISKIEMSRFSVCTWSQDVTENLCPCLCSSLSYNQSLMHYKVIYKPRISIT